MKKAMGVAVLLLAACGGGSGFDQEAARDWWSQQRPTATDDEIDELVDITHDSCGLDDDAFVLLVTQSVGQGQTLNDLRAGCAARTEGVVADLEAAGVAVSG